MNLVVDIGNTRTKVAVFSDSEMIKSTVFTGPVLPEIEKLLRQVPDIQNAIVSSVKDHDHKSDNFIKENIKGRFVLLDKTTPVPIKNNYHSPETLGKDRLAAVAGAKAMYPGSNILVVDAGTAVTFDFVNTQGEYWGGNISPGLEMRFKALNLFTDKLPACKAKDQYPDMGFDTETAIISGVIKGMIYEMEGYISMYAEKYSNLKILFTGGDADFFVKNLKKTIFVVQNLTLIGLNYILLYNEKLR
ncbi:MAG: type III pantothenate kinase [Bacteroidales bacterium]|nr:type III pantothenate kinase [Bacteroidales bacterium]